MSLININLVKILISGINFTKELIDTLSAKDPNSLTEQELCILLIWHSLYQKPRRVRIILPKNSPFSRYFLKKKYKGLKIIK